MELSPQIIKIFQQKILNWYSKHKRDLPWRRVPYDTRLQQRDPYRILVSEIMLQQTQVQRVIPKYEAWMQRFPNLQALSQASTAEVLTYWSGLGYNRRALYLQKLAKKLVELDVVRREEDGESIWPQTEKELMQLPGIGKYTARALLCFAFNKEVAVVDTNVRKVILCHFDDWKEEKSPKALHKQGDLSVASLLRDDSNILSKSEITKEEIERIAEQLLPHGKAYEWNQALMDYSSAMLKQHKIPIQKQSQFKDSDRYYRGAIIRFLIQHEKLSFNKIKELFEKDKKVIDDIRLKKILKRLEKDGLIIKKKNSYNIVP